VEQQWKKLEGTCTKFMILVTSRKEEEEIREGNMRISTL
jgi:hypothetical protein